MAVFEIDIGTSGVVAGGGAPYNTYYHDTRCQFIVLASELQARGAVAGSEIRSLYLHCAEQPGRDLANLRIRLQNTMLETVTSWVNSGWTLVYGPKNISKSLLPADVWYEHVFDTPFIWDGQNLLIDISRDDVAGAPGGGNYVRQLSTYRLRYGYSNSAYPWPFETMPGSNVGNILEIKLNMFAPANEFLSEVVSQVNVTDKQRYFESVLSEIVSLSNQSYLEVILSELASQSLIFDLVELVLLDLVNLESYILDKLHGCESVLATVKSESYITEYKRAITAFLDYLLSVADQYNYKLDVKDLITFSLKTTDLLQYVQKVRDLVTYDLKVADLLQYVQKVK